MTLEECRDCRRLVARRLLPLLSVNFNFLKYLPADTMLAIFVLIVRAVIAVIQSFRSCGRTARISGSQHLHRLADQRLGSDGPLKVRGEVRPSLPEGTAPEELGMLPTDQEMIRAGGKRN